MLKKLFNTLRSRFLTPVASMDIAPQTSGKRQSEANDQPAKKWKKADPRLVQQMQEGNVNRKRKVALLLAYNGKGYYGLQINPGFRTVESDLCKALVAVGLVPQEHADEMQKMSFQRAARTDKGVSAAANVVSLKMLLNVDDIEGKLNEQLAPAIRVMAWKRTTQSFNSKNYCDARTYIYMLPTYSFAPVEVTVTDDYRVSADILDHVNSILQRFVGTHNFYNFTSRVKADAANAKRYIMSFECGKPVVRRGVEFVVISVKGQSFMLHQIRKMIGLTIAVARGYCGTDAIDLAWQPEKIDIPIAPSMGLMLDKLHYDGYNQRYGKDGLHEPLDWSSVQDKVEKFKEEYIFSDMVTAEVEDRSMISWLATLHIHTFSTERTRSGMVIANLKEIDKERAAAVGEESAGAAADGAALDGPVSDGAADGTADGAADGTASDLQAGESGQNADLANKTEEGKASNNQNDSYEEPIQLSNQNEDISDSNILTNPAEADRTTNQIDFSKSSDRLANQESTQDASLSPANMDCTQTQASRLVDTEHMLSINQSTCLSNVEEGSSDTRTPQEIVANDPVDATNKTVEDDISSDTQTELKQDDISSDTQTELKQDDISSDMQAELKQDDISSDTQTELKHADAKL